MGETLNEILEGVDPNDQEAVKKRISERMTQSDMMNALGGADFAGMAMRQVDLNKDGYLTEDELNVMKDMAAKKAAEKGEAPPPDAVKQGMKLYDDDGDGKLNKAEFGN